LTLSEKNGNSYLSYLNEDKSELTGYKAYRGVYQIYNDGDVMGANPIKVQHIYLRQLDRIQVLWGDGNSKGVELESSSFKKIRTFEDCFASMDYITGEFAPVWVSGSYINNASKMFCVTGKKLYANLGVSGANYDYVKYNVPIAGDYELSKVLCPYMDKHVSYDEKNGRYVVLNTYPAGSSAASTLLPLLNDPEGEFEYENVNMNLVYSFDQVLSEYHARSCFVLEDEGDYYMQVIATPDMYTPELVAQLNKSFPAGSVTQNSMFAANSEFPYIYVCTGKTISIINTIGFVGQGEINLSPFATMENEITAIECSADGETLAVATSDGTNGELVLIDTDIANGGAILSRWNDLGIIKDIDERTTKVLGGY